MEHKPFYRLGARSLLFGSMLVVALCVLLYIVSDYNYLLFHTIVEFFSITVALGIFVTGWNARDKLKSSFLPFLGIVYLFIAFLDFLHTLAYAGMGVFKGYNANLPTQLWIATRFMESLSLFAAIFLLRRKIRYGPIFLLYFALSLFLVDSIFYLKIFPTCYIEGTGLTPFKKLSEYIISTILLITVFLVNRRKKRFEEGMFFLFITSIILTVFSELAFTFYISVYGFSNMVGHIFKVASFYMIYRAVIQKAITEPYDLIFRDFKESQESLMRINEYLETRVKERTADLNHANVELRNSEARYMDLYENAPDMFASVDAKTAKIIECNETMARMTGYSKEEIIGRPVFEIYHPSCSKYVKKTVFPRFKKTGVIHNEELQIRRKDGTSFDVILNATAVLDDTGNVLYSRSILHDITERKRVEDKLRKSEKKVLTKLKAILSPEGDIGELNLADILDVESIQTIMDDFYKLTNLGVAISDLSAKVLVATGWQDICTQFHRVNPETCKNCIESDSVLSRDVQPGTFKLYRCKNNMWDIATPIIVGGKKMGNMYFGQFFFSDETVDYEVFRSQARRYGFDEDRYLAALDRVPRLSRDTIDTLMTFYTKFAQLTSTLSYSNIKLARTLTERDTLLNSLREGEKKYRTVADYTYDWEYWVSPDGSLVYISPSCERITGYRAEEFLADPELLNTITHPDDREKHSLHKTECIQGTALQYDFRIITRGGEVRWMEHACQSVYDDDGPLLGRRASNRDVTERKRAEEALRESEEVFHNLFQTSRDFICITDLEGAIIDANNAALELFGYSYEEFSAMKAQDLFVNPEDGQIIMDLVSEYGYVKNREIELKKKDGEIIDAIMTVNVRKDENGNTIGFFSIGKDVTEKKRLELQLLQTEKLSAVGTMISGIAHEINNPLTSIIGYSQLLSKRDVPKDIRSKIDVILKESIRSSKIVGNLLTFAREHKPERKMININDILMESIKLREYELSVSNIDVRTFFSNDLPWTFADPYQIQQVFVNLINNALDAIVADREGGVLTIRTERRNDSVLIGFEDNGPGIPGEIVNKVFEPFFTTKETGKGTGLGLSMAYGIIEEHGGTISVESKPGEWAKFVVTLPITEDRGLTKKKGKTFAKQLPGEKTVLVVEDEASLRDFLLEALTDGGFTVEVASTGKKAINLLETKKYDAMVSDIKMPGISGKELYLYVRKHHPEIASKIVFITGDVLSKDTQEFLNTTKSRFIEKPFDIDDLIAILNDVLWK